MDSNSSPGSNQSKSDHESKNFHDPNDSTPPQPPSPQPPVYPSPTSSFQYPRPLKDRNLALVLEILPGLFGILGIGWIYSGKTGTGITWLVGYLVWVIIVVIAAAISGGLACICTVPVNLICVGLSAYMLNNYTKSNPQFFGL